ncbi:MAG: MopE-related protein [Candidatus Aenigmatarchaeota archaeon]
MVPRFAFLLSLALALLVLALPVFSGAILFTFQGVGNVSAGGQITGVLVLEYSKYIPRDSTLNAYIDGNLVSAMSLYNYLYEQDYYTFSDQPFSYNLTAYGENSWATYPEEMFNYTITGGGACGGDYCCPNATDCWCDCPCGSGYGTFPCDWTSDFSYTGTVRRTSGLKFIYDAESSITVPTHHNNDTVWEISDDNPDVETFMRAGCAGQSYANYPVQLNGWLVREIQEEELEVIPGTSDREATIPPFEHNSLLEPLRSKYNDVPGVGTLPGGIYRDGVYQTPPGEVEFDGDAGYIRIKNYISTSDYLIVFIPPNGPMLCAYTQSQVGGSESWTRTITIEDVSASYAQPYTKQWSPGELTARGLSPPACPVQPCNRTTQGYTSVESYDPSDSITLAFDSENLTVTAATNSTDLTRGYRVTFDLGNFTALKAPQELGPHTLAMKIMHQGRVLAEGSTGLDVCSDSDFDGYCPETGDCDDTEEEVHPGALERCNGLDDDCDGDIDEDFWAAGTKLGSPCGTGICEGIWVCTRDGVGVECSSKYKPGDVPEICNDSLDNDCDGVIDEEVDLVDSRMVPGCVCRPGDTKPCGSNIGYCQAGHMLCVNYEWSDCKDQVLPGSETCNQADDDCDGVIDNVGGGKSMEAAGCRCYAGGSPLDETCNDIDDDCDGEIDEGLICCSTGETRSCGSDIGACTKGTQACADGVWGACTGGLQPVEEVCYDSIDNNCDGEADENCLLEFTCRNGVKDLNEDGIDCGGPCPRACAFGETPMPYFILAALGILLIIAVGALSVLGKI